MVSQISTEVANMVLALTTVRKVCGTSSVDSQTIKKDKVMQLIKFISAILASNSTNLVKLSDNN